MNLRFRNLKKTFYFLVLILFVNLEVINVLLNFAPQDVLSEEIARRQLQLVNGMEMCESQFNAIQRNLDNPALQPQRDRLIQLQVNILSSFAKKKKKQKKL